VVADPLQNLIKMVLHFELWPSDMVKSLLQVLDVNPLLLQEGVSIASLWGISGAGF